MTNTVERTVTPRILLAIALCFLGALGVFAPRGAAQGTIITVTEAAGMVIEFSKAVLATP